jgi:hypothetical protein
VVWDGESWEFEEDLISSNSSFSSKFHYSNAREGGRLLCGVILGWVVGWNLGLHGVLDLTPRFAWIVKSARKTCTITQKRETDTRER